MAKTELQNTCNGTAQATVNNEEADNSQITTVIDGHSESDVQRNEQLDRGVLVTSPRDVNSLVVVSPAKVLIVEANAVLDDDRYRDSSQIETVDVNTKTDKSSQGGLSESDRKVEGCREAGEVRCLPTPEVAEINESCGATVNSECTATHMCEDMCQDPCSCSTPKSESPELEDSVKENRGCALSGMEKATVEISSSKDLPVVDLHSSQSLRPLGSPDLPEAEAKCAVGKKGSQETSASGDHSVLVVRGSGETAELQSVISITFESPLQQDSVTVSGVFAVSGPEKPTIEMPSLKDLPDVVDLHSSPSPRFLDSLGLQKCVVAEKCCAETLANGDPSISVVRGSKDMTESPSVVRVTTESFEQPDSVMETDCALPSPEKATIETSVNTECCQTDECPVETSVVMVDAQNSPVHFQTTSTVGCSPVHLPATVAEVSRSDAQLTETVECSVQTSPHVVDSGCSPIHHVMTHSIGCSPVEVETRSVITSPMLLPTVGCSVQTEQLLIDAQCSPMVLPLCVEAITPHQQWVTKHSMASTDRRQSQTVDDSTSPSVPQIDQHAACGEPLCRKLSSVSSAVESESSYATPSGMACSNEDPMQVAGADGQQSVEDSTQPQSCEELFDNDSPLSCRSPSSVAHQLCSTSPSQLSHLQLSPAEAEM